MIRRPEQLRLIRCGLPVIPANRSSDNASTSSTSNTYQDRRNAVQGGIGISGDGNTTNATVITTDMGAVTAGIGAATQAAGIAGTVAANAIGTTGAVAVNANSTMADVSKSVVAASSHLADVGLSMLQTNTALANELYGGTLQSTQAVTGIAQQLAQTQIAAQNDNRYLIAAGMAVVAIVAFASLGKGKA